MVVLSIFPQRLRIHHRPSNCNLHPIHNLLDIDFTFFAIHCIRDVSHGKDMLRNVTWRVSSCNGSFDARDQRFLKTVLRLQFEEE